MASRVSLFRVASRVPLFRVASRVPLLRVAFRVPLSLHVRVASLHVRTAPLLRPYSGRVTRTLV
ncbi:hypothetical protein GCM10018785_25070 [Streptomyces longispororuber]|uniref:Uncharacterized protein n=1 Tax=Streptomyces longispororuber TaxID=68230 RepID=A0A919DJP9_9ACTN|nr:hypothetical protein GCM10018785_25070 [Streptomyces longispororuber]